jgi:hypothetical protein
MAKVYVLIDLVSSSPENMGAVVYSTREAAETAKAKMIEENKGDGEYIAEILETEIKP